MYSYVPLAIALGAGAIKGLGVICHQRIHDGGERLAQRKSKAMPRREFVKKKSKIEELKGIKNL